MEPYLQSIYTVYIFTHLYIYSSVHVFVWGDSLFSVALVVVIALISQPLNHHQHKTKESNANSNNFMLILITLRPLGRKNGEESRVGGDEKKVESLFIFTSTKRPHFFISTKRNGVGKKQFTKKISNKFQCRHLDRSTLLPHGLPTAVAAASAIYLCCDLFHQDPRLPLQDAVDVHLLELTGK